MLVLALAATLATALCDHCWLQAIHTARIRHQQDRLAGISPLTVLLIVATATLWLDYGLAQHLWASVVNSCLVFVSEATVAIVMARAGLWTPLRVAAATGGRCTHPVTDVPYAASS